MIYPSLENVLNHQTHTDVLPGVQDGYGLGIPVYLGADISQADLNNLQAGIGLNGAEVL